MSLNEFAKEREIQKNIEDLFTENSKPVKLDEGKIVKVSKADLKEFLKKEDEPIVPVEPVEEEQAEEVAVIEEPVEENEPEVEEQEETTEPTIEKPNITDKYLEGYEDPKEQELTNSDDAFRGVGFGGGGENNSIVNIGGGIEIYKDKLGPDLRIRTLSATGSTTVTENGNLIVIDSSADADTWPTVSADYYNANQVDALVSANADTWPTVSADYYTKTETIDGTPLFEVLAFSSTPPTPSWQEGVSF